MGLWCTYNEILSSLTEIFGFTDSFRVLWKIPLNSITIIHFGSVVSLHCVDRWRCFLPPSSSLIVARSLGCKIAGYFNSRFNFGSKVCRWTFSYGKPKTKRKNFQCVAYYDFATVEEIYIEKATKKNIIWNKYHQSNILFVKFKKL